MTDTAKTKFSNNLIAIAGLITAVGGLLTVLHQTGVVSFSSASNNPTTIGGSQGVDAAEKPKLEPIAKEVPENNIVPVKNVIAEPEPVAVNLSGDWYDEINGGRYQFIHDAAGSLSFQEFSWMNGIWMITAEGSGTIQGQKINLTYMTVYGLSGAFEGTIDEGGKGVSGFAMDLNSGMRTSMHLSRE